MSEDWKPLTRKEVERLYQNDLQQNYDAVKAQCLADGMVEVEPGHFVRGRGMSDMIERVAMAIQASDDAEPFFACACGGKENPDDFACPCKMRASLRRARASIEAMREPTEGMLAALHPKLAGMAEVGSSLTAICKAVSDAALE